MKKKNLIIYCISQLSKMPVTLPCTKTNIDAVNIVIKWIYDLQKYHDTLILTITNATKDETKLVKTSNVRRYLQNHGL